MTPGFTTRPELTGDFGMVASTHWLATGTGMSVLERGGNAADAAAATAFVLQVVEPHLNGPGGEAPILLSDPADARVRVIAGQGPTPAGATIGHYRSEGLDLVPGTGLLAATVPGAVAAWLTLLERWGTWRLRDVLEPAVTLAERGWPLLPSVAATLATVAGTFRSDWPHSAATWLTAAGEVPAVGSRMRNPELAATWRRLVAAAEAESPDRDRQLQAARRAFSGGFVAAAIDAHCRRPVPDSAGRHAGVLTGADLAGWECPVEDPVTLDYAGYTVCKTGPWGQGPIFLQQLALLSGFDLPAAGHLTGDYLHTVLECAKLAFADREAWYGDPDAVDVPVRDLLSAPYNDERRALVGAAAARELRPGAPGGRVPVLPDLAAIGGVGAGVSAGVAAGHTAGAGEPTVDARGTTRGDTCHLDVVDRHGMTIAATPSGGWLQSSPTIPGLGFCLGTRAQMTWLQPGLPSSLRPGVRPRTTLSPTLALRDGRPYLAFGTPGGDQQDQWTLLFFLSHVHFGLGLQAAIDAPTLHSTDAPSSFWPRDRVPAGVVAEDRIPVAVLDDLRRRGHDVTPVGPWTLGRITAVGRDPDTGFLRAAANPRGGTGYAAGR